MLSLAPNGDIVGSGTLKIGQSQIAVNGRLARADIARLKAMIERGRSYYDSAGYDITAGWEEDLAKIGGTVLQVAGGVANKAAEQGYFGEYGSYVQIAGTAAQIGGQALQQLGGAQSPTAAQVQGPYQAASLAAAQGNPQAINLMARAGIPAAHAQQVAQLTSPDPAQRAEADRRVQNMLKAVKGGNQIAAQITKGLQAATAAQLRNLLQESQIQLAAKTAELAKTIAERDAAQRAALQAQAMFQGAQAFAAPRGPAPMAPAYYGAAPPYFAQTSGSDDEAPFGWWIPGDTSGGAPGPDPLSAFQAMGIAPPAAVGSGPLNAALDRGLAQARLRPQPSFRRALRARA